MAELLGRAELQKCLLLIFLSLLRMLALVATRKGNRIITVALLAALLAASVGFTCWIGVEPIVSRFSILPAQESPYRKGGGRVALWRDTAQLIRRHPWFGVGPGGFETAFT